MWKLSGRRQWQLQNPQKPSKMVLLSVGDATYVQKAEVEQDTFLFIKILQHLSIQTHIDYSLPVQAV